MSSSVAAALRHAACTRMGTTASKRTTRKIASRHAEDNGGKGGVLSHFAPVRRRGATTNTPAPRRLTVTHSAYDSSRSLAVRLFFLFHIDASHRAREIYLFFAEIFFSRVAFILSAEKKPDENTLDPPRTVFLTLATASPHSQRGSEAINEELRRDAE